jgi:hypothetical protein
MPAFYTDILVVVAFLLAAGALGPSNAIRALRLRRQGLALRRHEAANDERFET